MSMQLGRNPCLRSAPKGDRLGAHPNSISSHPLRSFLSNQVARRSVSRLEQCTRWAATCGEAGAAESSAQPSTIEAESPAMSQADRVVITCAGKELTLETGEIGQLADGSVMASCGGTVIHTTACCKHEADTDGSFTPLTVIYQERMSAAGKTSGGYIKRDGRPRESDILTSRLVDRPLRPMFPEGWARDTQVIQWVYSYDGINASDALAITAAGAALLISSIPIRKAVAGVRVGRKSDGTLMINPTVQEMETSTLDLVIAGTVDAVLMIEGFADFLSEDDILDAVVAGHEAVREVCEQMQEWAARVGKEKNAERMLPPEGLTEQVLEAIGPQLDEAYRIASKQERGKRADAIKSAFIEDFSVQRVEAGAAEVPEPQMAAAMKKAESAVVRSMLLNEQRRSDGRSLQDIRPITCRARVLPNVHGSCLFARGETQCLAVATLGAESDMLRQESLDADHFESARPFYLQYFFPPSATGETGRMGAPGRRESGHGMLAERALSPTVPDPADYPFTMRVEANVTMSNGSSSMASVCAGCIALQDAGVPIKEPVAGIAMGLCLAPSGDFVVMSDILGSEDALGDMDFKVAGGAEGVTAFQMDIKVEGITVAIMRTALQQARIGRQHILSRMQECTPAPRREHPSNAPWISIGNVDPNKVGGIIGSGGRNVRLLKEATGVTSIDFDDHGQVKVCGDTRKAVETALQMIMAQAQDVEAGTIVKQGKITRVEPYGVLVEVVPFGASGMCHVSEWDATRVESMADVAKVGDLVDVKVLEVDGNRIKLSRRALMPDAQEAAPPSRPAGKQDGPPPKKQAPRSPGSGPKPRVNKPKARPPKA